jgi:hypothetical protein
LRQQKTEAKARQEAGRQVADEMDGRLGFHGSHECLTQREFKTS